MNSRLTVRRNEMILAVSVISPVSVRRRYRTKLNLHGLHPRKFNNFLFVFLNFIAKNHLADSTRKWDGVMMIHFYSQEQQ